MKTIINKKVYNTKTAKEIATYSFSNSSDFNWFCETLYKTNKGAWFLHGEGGPTSIYAKSIGNRTVAGSEKIIVMTDNEAYNWLEEHNCVDEIEEFFGDNLEDA